MSIKPELRSEVLALSPEDRQELADELYESLDEADPEWQREWSAELERRRSDVAAGRVKLIDADDVHRELLDELTNRPR